MKYLCNFLICFVFSLAVTSAQPKYFDLGITGGTSYYLGDINQSRQFYKPSPAFGAFARYNFNNREAVRLSFTYISLKGDDNDFNNIYQQLRGASFNGSLLEIAGTFEFHFLPYIIHKREKGFSPYLYSGLAYHVLVSGPGNKGIDFAVPFGAGIKYSLSKKVGIGVEWGMRKTFNDHIDGVTNPGEEGLKPVINNNDWYSFAGFFISFRLNDKSGDCPVYW